MTTTARKIFSGFVTVAAAALVLFPIVVILLERDPNVDPWQRLTIGAGYLGMTFLCAQLVFSARSPVLDRLFGCDRMVAVHRVNGFVVLSVVFFHGLLALVRPEGSPARIVLQSPAFAILTSGVTAGAAFGFAALVGIVRDKLKTRYEVWRNLHRVAYYALPLALLHATVSTFDKAENSMLFAHSVATAVLAFSVIIGRARRYLTALHKPTRITEVVTRASDVTSIRLSRPDGFTFAPGQFCEISTSSESSHPFSISSGTGETYLELTAKTVGDFTTSFSRFAANDAVVVVGPYGRVTPARVVTRSHVGLIAGGIGITPFISMVSSDEFWDRPGLERVTLVWSVRAETSRAFIGEIEEATRSRLLTVLIVVTNGGQVPVNDREEPPDAEHANFSTSLPFTTGKRISELPADQLGFDKGSHDSTYVLCGPDGFMRSCRRMLTAAGVPASHIFDERFRF